MKLPFPGNLREFGLALLLRPGVACTSPVVEETLNRPALAQMRIWLSELFCNRSVGVFAAVADAPLTAQQSTEGSYSPHDSSSEVTQGQAHAAKEIDPSALV